MSQEVPPETPSPVDDADGDATAGALGEWEPGSLPEFLIDSPPAGGRRKMPGMRRSAAVALALGGLVLGSAAGGFLITRATGPATTVAAAGTSTITASPSPGPQDRGGFGGPSALFGVNLLQDAATTIGISEQTLEGDLQSGQTVAQVATAHGTTAQAVITALVGDETTAIDNLASSGKITSAQKTKLQSGVTQLVTNFVNRARPTTAPVGLGGSGEQAALQAAATAIGVSASTLRADLAKGESIASVAAAQSPSVSAATVVGAVTTVVDSQISGLESSGKITSAQASALTSEVQSRVTEWVDGTYPGWPFGPFGAVGGAGGFGGSGGPFAGGPWGHGFGPSPSASAPAV